MKCKKAAILRFETLPSTNDYAKEKRGEGKNLFIIAKEQSGGRGTKGRRFSSARGGVYVSALSFYENLPAKHAFRIMQNAAVSVCETLRSFGVTPQIKWPNDILVNGKKICGILIENTFSGEDVHSSIVGIGVNVCNELPLELQEIATTLAKETGKEIAVSKVEKRLLKHLKNAALWKRYPQYVGFIGRSVSLICGEETLEVKMLGVDEEGNLLAETKEGEKKFSSAEVSLRSEK